MTEEKPTYEQQLQVIDAMIAQAKRRPNKADSLNTLLWGYLVFSASLLHWALVQYGIEEGYHAWWLMAVGIVLSLLLNYKLAKEERVKTYIDSIIAKLWLGFGIGFFVVFTTIGPGHPFFLAVVMVLFALGMWVKGALIKFIPFSIGAVSTWGLAIWAAFATPHDQLLIIALAILLGHLIPGHLLLANTKKKNV